MLAPTKRATLSEVRPRDVAATVVMPPMQGEPLPTLYSSTLLKLYSPFVHVAFRLRDSTCTAHNVQSLWGELNRRLDDAKAYSIAQGSTKADVLVVELAVVAMLDSAALASSHTVRAVWMGDTLEQRRLQSENAGEQFFTIYQQLLDGTRPELLELYLWALRTGFTGGKSSAELTSLIHRGEQLLNAGRAPVPLFVLPSSSSAPAPRAAPPLAGWVLPAVTVAFALLLFGAVSALLYAQARVVGRELEQIFPVAQQERS